MDKDTLEKLSENLQTWLNDKLIIKDAITEEERETTNIQRITELYIKNRGNLEVTDYGIIEPADFGNPYGAYGLSEGEAMELVAFSNAIWGYALALGVHDDTEWFEKNLWDKIKEIHQKDLVIAKDNALKAMEKHQKDETPERPKIRILPETKEPPKDNSLKESK